MTYDLPAIVKQSRKKVRKPIRTRGPTMAMERRLAAVYREVVKFWRGRIKTLEPQFVVADAMPEPEQLEAEQVDLFLAALIRELQEWAARSAEWVRLTWVQRVRAETGVDIELLATSQAGHEQIRAAIEWATALIRDLNDQTRNRLVSALHDATMRGALQSEAQAIVNDVLEGAERRARLIAHDQTQKIVAKLNESQQREAGIEEYVWQHSFLPNARRHHVERQGNRYRWDKPPRDGHPGYAINCRCTAAAAI